MGKFIDLTDMTFNSLTVKSRSDKKGKKIYWNCICECGNKCVVSGSNLKTGAVKSCGHKKRFNHHTDIRNRVFGRLTAIEPIGTNKHNQVLWKCNCTCGKSTICTTTNLLLGKTKSCGCLAKELTSLRSFKDIKGLKFGSWTVLERDYKRQQQSSNGKVVYWKCKCVCGSIKSVSATSLRYGDTKSCGCDEINFSGSKEENEIKDYIISLVPDTIIEKSRILDGKEIDIYLPEYNLGIEYNGSAFHASENGLFSNKDKYYHRDKFLLAKKKGIHLISVFDVDYELNKNKILSYIKDYIFKTVNHEIPTEPIVYTNNDYDDGEWLKEYGYVEDSQIEPESYKVRSFIVYRSGKTKYVK